MEVTNPLAYQIIKKTFWSLIKATFRSFSTDDSQFEAAYGDTYPDFSVVVACRKLLVVPRKTAATDTVLVSLQQKRHLPQGTAPHLREQNPQLWAILLHELN